MRDNGKVRELRLHHVDGLRQQARGRGLDHVPRLQDGVIEHPGRRFTKASVEATRDEILIKELGWRLRRVPPPACLAGRSPIGPRNIGRIRLGLTRRALSRIPVKPIRRTRRSYVYCVNGSRGRVTVVVPARGRGGARELVTTTARGHRIRRVGPGASARRLAPALPRAPAAIALAGPRPSGAAGGCSACAEVESASWPWQTGG